ncbi:MAG: 50S ribosome-binding GTPase, partial [Peptococcaceae bacterium]|nr:50S ribosome-binding GTPase [Peptococcaceae bacterium]
MKIGLIGLNQTGKTTLFNLLTGREEGDFSVGKGAVNTGTGLVPDERIDFLSELYRPKKTTYARIELTDIAGFSVAGEGKNSGAAKFLNDVRPCEALIHVLRAFESDAVTHDLDSVDPARDLEAVETEMLFADLELVEKRIERIKAGKKITKENADEMTLLERCFTWLEKGGAMREMDLSPAERLAVRNYAFLTEKPRMAVVNLDESQWKAKSWPKYMELRSLCTNLGIPLLELCVEMELEINRLP